MTERQEQSPSSFTNDMDTERSQYMTRKNIYYALELQEIVSLPLGSPCATLTLPYYLSLGTPRCVIEEQ